MVQLSEHLEHFKQSDDLVACVQALKGYDEDDLSDLESVARQVASSSRAKEKRNNARYSRGPANGCGNAYCWAGALPHARK